MTTERISISERISYWKATDTPLSADVGMIEGDQKLWLFDVGSSDRAAADIQALQGEKNIILSHFHPDHIGNWSRVSYQELYQGSYTYRHTKTGTVIEKELFVQDGAMLHIFRLPSSHAKGSIGLEVDGEYAFLGDGIYSTVRQGKRAYVAGLLLEEIRVLKSLTARFFLLSHDEAFIHQREEVLAALEALYARRTPDSPYIFLEGTD